MIYNKIDRKYYWNFSYLSYIRDISLAHHMSMKHIGYHSVNTHIPPENNQRSRDIVLPLIRICILQILLLTPSFPTQGGGEQISSKQASWRYDEKKSPAERLEVQVSRDAIFRDWIQKVLNWLNDINQIPIGGKHIDYYRDAGDLKWKKITSESVRALNLPQKFDVSPRNIRHPVPSMVFHLGDRKFEITPTVWKIKNISLTSEALIITTNILNLDIVYNKENKLPTLISRLWSTHAGKWEKKWFKWTTVIEI